MYTQPNDTPSSASDEFLHSRRRNLSDAKGRSFCQVLHTQRVNLGENTLRSHNDTIIFKQDTYIFARMLLHLMCEHQDSLSSNSPSHANSSAAHVCLYTMLHNPVPHCEDEHVPFACLLRYLGQDGDWEVASTPSTSTSGPIATQVWGRCRRKKRKPLTPSQRRHAAITMNRHRKHVSRTNTAREERIAYEARQAQSPLVVQYMSKFISRFITGPPQADKRQIPGLNSDLQDLIYRYLPYDEFTCIFPVSTQHEPYEYELLSHFWRWKHGPGVPVPPFLNDLDLIEQQQKQTQPCFATLVQDTYDHQQVQALRAAKQNGTWIIFVSAKGLETTPDWLGLGGCFTHATFLFPGVRKIGNCFLSQCNQLQSVDFAGCFHVETISFHCLSECSQLTHPDFTGLTNLVHVGAFWMRGCALLEKPNFDGLAQLESVGEGWMKNCSVLQEPDFSGLVNLKMIGPGWMEQCLALQQPNFGQRKHLQQIFRSR